MLAKSVHASRATTRASSFATNRCRRRRHTIERHNNGVGRRRRTFSFALAAAEDDRDGGENVEEVDDRTFIDSFDRDGSAHATSSSPPSSSTNPLPVNFSRRRSGAPRKKTQREIEAQTIEDVNGFHSPWSQYEFRVEEDDDDDTTPWEEHMKEVMELLDEEKKQSLFLPWNKLEKGIKYERLCHFLKTQKNDYTMNETQYTYNRELITDMFKNNNLNKLSDVKYDVEQGKIVSLTKLKLNETHLIYEII